MNQEILLFGFRAVSEVVKHISDYMAHYECHLSSTTILKFKYFQMGLRYLYSINHLFK